MKLPILCFAIMCGVIATTAFADKKDALLRRQTQEMMVLRDKLVSTEADKIKWEETLVIYHHYVEAGMIYKYYWITPELIYNIITWGRKYKYLAPDFNYDTIDSEIFFLCWIANESSFDPRSSNIYINKNGAKDYWLCQINEVWRNEPIPAKNLWRRADALFPVFMNRPDSDPEKNVCVFYLWLNKQTEFTHNGVWDIYRRWTKRKDVLALFDKLKEVK